MKPSIDNAGANSKSWKAWKLGLIQALLYGIAAAILSALGINGTAAFEWVAMEPLNLSQLVGILVTTGLGRLAQYILITPIPGVSVPHQQ